MNELLKSNDVTLVYLSIDKGKREQQWEDVIKFYDLEGHHMRANESLYADLLEIYDANGSMAIPWHILIDEEGNMVKTHAHPPSELEALEKQIEGI